MFELTVLISSLTTVGAMFVLNGLPCFYHPVLKSPKLDRITNDRFYIVIEASDPKFTDEETRAFLESLGPESVEPLEP